MIESLGEDGPEKVCGSAVGIVGIHLRDGISWKDVTSAISARRVSCRGAER